MNTWDAVCRVALAAEELSRCDYIDAEEANILRDASEAISDAIWASLLRRMRSRLQGVCGGPGVPVAVPETPESGRTRVREPDDQGREPAPVSPVQGRERGPLLPVQTQG